MNKKYNIQFTETGMLDTNLPKEYRIVEDLLVADVSVNSGRKYLQIFNKVIHDGVDAQITGNTTTLQVTQEKTKVTNNYLEKSCDILTSELRMIIESYLKLIIMRTLAAKAEESREKDEKAKLENIINKVKVKEFTGDLWELLKQEKDKRA